MKARARSHLFSPEVSWLHQVFSLLVEIQDNSTWLVTKLVTKLVTRSWLRSWLHQAGYEAGYTKLVLIVGDEAGYTKIIPPGDQNPFGAPACHSAIEIGRNRPPGFIPLKSQPFHLATKTPLESQPATPRLKPLCVTAFVLTSG